MIIRTTLITGMMLALAIGLSACGKDDRDSAARDAEIQKKLQEGSQRERQMYEGMQKVSKIWKSSRRRQRKRRLNN